MRTPARSMCGMGPIVPTRDGCGPASYSRGVANPAEYDEMGLFHENASEAGLPWDGPPTVRRVDTTVEGRIVSALAWGSTAPELVLIHGGGQNAHTWDTVALALGVPLLA